MTFAAAVPIKAVSVDFNFRACPPADNCLLSVSHDVLTGSDRSAVNLVRCVKKGEFSTIRDYLVKDDIMAEYCEYEWGLRRQEIDITCRNSEKKTCDKKQAVIAVQQLIPSRPEIDFLRTDEDFILRFLHARKCGVQESFDLLANYYSYRKRNKDLFLHFNANEIGIRNALKDGFPGVLPERDRKGRCVLVIFTAHWDHCSYSLMSIYRALLLTLERLIEKPRNQLNGFVFIVDWSEFSFRQSSNLNPRVLKLMIEGLQDCFPARFKGIHFINQPWYVEAALTVIRPFLKEKTKEKIYLHGNNMSTLHDYVTKDILPAELGGEGPSYNPVQWADKLLEIEQTLGAEVGKGLETSDSKSESIRKSETFPVHCSKKLDGSNGYETSEVYEC